MYILPHMQSYITNSAYILLHCHINLLSHLPNTIRYPGAMMVKLFHTMLTGRTVFGAHRPDNLVRKSRKQIKLLQVRCIYMTNDLKEQ